MTYRESVIATFLIAFSAIVGMGIVEAGYHIYQRAFPPPYDWNRRIMFFDGPGSIFRKLHGIFTYEPNSYIFSRAVYFSELTFSTEYACKFKTNNFGLVQDKDLVRGVKFHGRSRCRAMVSSGCTAPRSELPYPEPVKAKTVINKFVEKYGRENVLFIQLPQKEELKGTSLPDGLLARKIIQDSGAGYADGISLCGLNGADFFVRDGHPSQKGYGKIAKCVAQIIEPFLMQVN